MVDRYSVARNFQPLGMYSAGRRTSTAPRRGKTAVEAQHSFMQQEGSQRSRAFNLVAELSGFFTRAYKCCRVVLMCAFAMALLTFGVFRTMLAVSKETTGTSMASKETLIEHIVERSTPPDQERERFNETGTGALSSKYTLNYDDHSRNGEHNDSSSPIREKEKLSPIVVPAEAARAILEEIEVFIERIQVEHDRRLGDETTGTEEESADHLRAGSQVAIGVIPDGSNPALNGPQLSSDQRSQVMTQRLHSEAQSGTSELVTASFPALSPYGLGLSLSLAGSEGVTIPQEYQEHALPEVTGSTGSAHPVSSSSTGSAHPVSSSSTGSAHPVSSSSTGSAHPVSSGSTGSAHPVSSSSTGSAHPVSSSSTGSAHPVSSSSTGSAHPVSSGSTGSAHPVSSSSTGSAHPVFSGSTGSAHPVSPGTSFAYSVTQVPLREHRSGAQQLVAQHHFVVHEVRVFLDGSKKRLVSALSNNTSYERAARQPGGPNMFQRLIFRRWQDMNLHRARRSVRHRRQRTRRKKEATTTSYSVWNQWVPFVVLAACIAAIFCCMMPGHFRHHGGGGAGSGGPRQHAHVGDAGPPFVGTATLKVPPAWSVERSSHYSLRSWISDLVLWSTATDVEPQRMGAIAALQVSGSAKELVRELAPDQLANGVVDPQTGQHVTGLMLLVQTLARRYAPLEGEISTKAVSDFLSFSRLPGESVDAFLVRFDVLRNRAQVRGGLGVNPSGLSWLLLRALGLSADLVDRLLQPLGGQLPQDDNQLAQLLDRIRRQGHLYEGGMRHGTQQAGKAPIWPFLLSEATKPAQTLLGRHKQPGTPVMVQWA